MTIKHTIAQAFSEEPMPMIPLVPVKSGQVKAIGYDPTTKVLAVTFTRGLGAIYHYRNVEHKTFNDFMAAESIGTYFGKHIKSLPFDKFAPPPETEPSSDAAAGGITQTAVEH